MRIRTSLAVLAAFLPLAVLTTGFGPGDDCADSGIDIGDQDALVCTFDTYLACPSTLPQQKTHLNAVDGEIALRDSAPTASVADGAGCGHQPEPFTNDLPTDEEFIVAGEFTGNVDSVAVEIHLLGPGIGHAGEAVIIPATLTVGDTTVSQDFEVVPEVSDTNASAKAVLVFPNLGLVTEAGAGTTARAVRLELGAATIPGACDPSGQTDGCMIAGPYPYVWDTTEVPSGLTFNGTR